jgi:hypothetical protein
VTSVLTRNDALRIAPLRLGAQVPQQVRGSATDIAKTRDLPLLYLCILRVAIGPPGVPCFRTMEYYPLYHKVWDREYI